MTDHTTELETAQVGIIMGSDSDLRVMQAAADMLGQLDVPFEMTIVSAHRTPERMMKYAESARERGLKTIIAGAGGAAHLPGMVASMTTLPVIGVPVAVTALKGQDSLLSIVQMPAGIPVATVAIDNAANAALLAAQILAVRIRCWRSDCQHFAMRRPRQCCAKQKRWLQTVAEGVTSAARVSLSFTARHSSVCGGRCRYTSETPLCSMV